jgi:hypothetical protein
VVYRSTNFLNFKNLEACGCLISYTASAINFKTCGWLSLVLLLKIMSTT